MNQNIGNTSDESEVAYWQDWQSMRARRLRMLPKRVLFAAVVLILLGIVSMVLWNWLMPSLFNLRTIGFWRALGIVILSRVLFGRLPSGPRGYWRNQRLQRWQRMTAEERQKIIEAMRHASTPGAEHKL